jgi:acetamidase/formamidase
LVRRAHQPGPAPTPNAIASKYRRPPRDFDKDGPHAAIGLVFVEGAQPGDVLKIATLDATPRVPYGVVSNRHGKGALARAADRGASAGISIQEVMLPVS